MNPILKRILFLLFVLIALALLYVSAPLMIIITSLHPETYETNDIADYGKIVGNSNNRLAREFVFSIFPEDLDDSFSTIEYHYKAKDLDAYSFEAYLEFSVEDPVAFTQSIKPYVNDSAPFPYDQSFMEVTIAQELWLHRSSSDQNLLYIDYARIGKILYSESEQRVIFFALGVLDGGGTSTSELSYFADRFNIDWEKLETESN